MNRRIPPDAATAADLRRLRDTRRLVRTRLRALDAAVAEAKARAFRFELARTVRSASSFLVALLDREGLTLDDVAARIHPASGWPRRPRISAMVRSSTSMGRYGAAVGHKDYVGFEMGGLHGIDVPLGDGGIACVRVLAHGLEVATRVGPVELETRFGMLIIRVPGDLPLAAAGAMIGRPLDDILDMRVTRGRGWRVSATSEWRGGATLSVRTGVLAFRMPVRRQA